MTTGDVVKVRCTRLPPPWTCSLEHEHHGPCTATRNPSVPERPLHVGCATYSDYQPAYGLFKEQRDAIDRWIIEHDASRHVQPGRRQRYTGASGGAYTYEFTSTTLGVSTTVRCSCGDRIDVSNYDEW